jgi:hypothetical protein
MKTIVAHEWMTSARHLAPTANPPHNSKLAAILRRKRRKTSSALLELKSC